MKRLTLFSLALCFAGFSFGQKKVVNAAKSALSDGILDKALENIEIAKENEETKVLPNTWFIRGKILTAIGSTKDDKYKNLADNPFREAWNSFEKAKSLDVKQKINKEIDIYSTFTFVPSVLEGAYNKFKDTLYDKALDLYELALLVESNKEVFKDIDTANIYNAGLAAFNAKKYEKSVEYFKQAVSYKYGGYYPYTLMKNSYMNLGDTTNALSTMKQAFEAYPGELSVIVDLVNFYLTTGQSAQAMSYLAVAKEKDPQNATFFFVEGILLEKEGKFEESLTSYNKAVELNPKYFDAYFNLGVLFYNKAVKLFDQASNEKDDTKYNEIQKKAEETLKQSIPYLEKAHEINPQDLGCAETLKSLYFRMQMNEKLQQLKQEMGW